MTRKLLDIGPNDSVADIIFDVVATALFSLLGLAMICLLLFLFGLAIYSVVEGAVT